MKEKTLRIDRMRGEAFKIWDRDGAVGISPVKTLFEGKVCNRTLYAWYYRWGKIRGVTVKGERKALRRVEEKKRAPLSELTWENIIKVVPNEEILGQLLIGGVISTLTENRQLRADGEEKDKELKQEKAKSAALTKDRATLMQEYNHLLSKTGKKRFSLGDLKALIE